MGLQVYLLLLLPWLAGKSPLSLCSREQPLPQGGLVGRGSSGSLVAPSEQGLEGGNIPLWSAIWRPQSPAVPSLPASSLLGLGHGHLVEGEGP